MSTRTPWFSAPVILAVEPVSDVIAPGATTLIDVTFRGWGWIRVDGPSTDDPPLPRAWRFRGASGVITLAVPVDQAARVRMRNLFGRTEQPLRIAATLSAAPPQVPAAQVTALVPASPFPLPGSLRVIGLRREPARRPVRAAKVSAQALIGHSCSRIAVPRVSRRAVARHEDTYPSPSSQNVPE